MSKIFPLPVSNNFKLFNYTFSTGLFAECTILWPAQFVKKDTVVGPEHVFILKNRSNDYFHCLWKWDSREPEMLLQNYWSNCFEQSKHTSISNRYLFTMHAFQLMLPYVPHMLHKKWCNTIINRRDDAFIISTFKNYFDLNIFNEQKKRYERFPGWQRKTIKNQLNQYVKFMTSDHDTEVPINLTIDIENLSPEKKQILDQTTALLHAIFPNFCQEIPKQ